MKILHIDPENSFGGGERQVLGLIRHLSRSGHENLLAAPAVSKIVDRLPPTDARVVPLSIRNDFDIIAGIKLIRLVARERPDVIHYHTGRAHKLAVWIPRQTDRSIVTRRMDYEITNGWLTDVLYNRRVAAVAAISSDVRRRLLAAGVHADRITLISSGVEFPDGLPTEAARRVARERFGACENELVLVTVASLERRKGHDVLLAALADLNGLPFRCLFAGAGSRQEELTKRVADLGLTNRVRFLGEQRQVADLLAAADLFVLPSRREGLGVAMLEAMAMGLPVLATRVGGIPDAVIHGETGVLVPPDDSRSLAAGIRQLASDRPAAREMGRRGRERSRLHFSMAAMANAYESLYASLPGVAEAVPMGDNHAR